MKIKHILVVIAGSLFLSGCSGAVVTDSSSSNKSSVKEWTAADVQVIYDFQKNLRHIYDNCLVQMNTNSKAITPEGLKNNRESCVFITRTEDQFDLMTKKYGDESIPQFLK